MAIIVCSCGESNTDINASSCNMWIAEKHKKLQIAPADKNHSPPRGFDWIASKVIDNFDDNDLYTTGGGLWRAYTDDLIGGTSCSSIAITASHDEAINNKVLRFDADIRTGFAFPFVGFKADFTYSGMRHNLSEFSGVKLTVRGNSPFQLQMLSDHVKDHNQFSASVLATNAWATHEIDFSELSQSPFFGERLNWTADSITGIGIHISGLPGEVFLELDQISLY